jgi:cob(I)alamin adenosyltransferase
MGHVYLYYGTGGGKTANALGLALRAVGHDQRVVVVQFMKWRTDIGEFKVRDKLAPYYEIRQFGNPGWLKFKGRRKAVSAGGVTLEVRDMEESDRALARKGLEFARRTMMEDEPDLLILDEICLAVHSGMLSVGEVLDLLKRVPEKTSVVLTGRYAPKELIDRADFVNEVVEIKSPAKFVTTKGIQY